jgi:hypothetical protein
MTPPVHLQRLGGLPLSVNGRNIAFEQRWHDAKSKKESDTKTKNKAPMVSSAIRCPVQAVAFAEMAAVMR